MKKMENIEEENNLGEEERGVEDTFDKPEATKKIESFDVNNLSEKEISFMTGVIQNYFLEHFPVKPELVAMIPEKIAVVDRNEFRRVLAEAEPDSEFGSQYALGFYNEDLDKMFINGTAHETMGALFATMFHESLHFVSIGAGAGLTGDFRYPSETAEEDGLFEAANKGLETMYEGTTQLITLSSVVDELGFDEDEQMVGYVPEMRVMGEIWKPFSKDERYKAYFELPLEKLRRHIELTFGSEDDEVGDASEVSNGVFVNCLANLGVATEKVSEACGIWGDDGDLEEVLRDVQHAVGAYFVRRSEVTRKEIDEEWAKEFSEYLEPYANDEEEEKDV